MVALRARYWRWIAAATATSISGSSCGTSAALKPLGYSSAIRPVLKLPEVKRGCCISAAWKAMLLATPRITNSFRASRMRAMAWSRVAAWTISLAIIES
jgi:hypothetical protein